MIKYIKEHEKFVVMKLNKSEDINEVRNYHLRQIQWLQHEQSVHLGVLALTSIVFLSVTVFLFFNPSVLLALLFLIFSLLELFYMIHYFRLENTVQKWYLIANTFDEQLHEISVNTYKMH